MAPAASSAADPLSLAAVATAAAPHGLAVLGAFHPGEGDGTPEGTGTLVLLGPDGPGFWDVFTASPEYGDGAGHPMDRWSTRIIDGLAAQLGAQALYPFGGPPWVPFIAWARASRHAFASRVGILVHDRAGLMVSYRGALALPGRLALPPPGLSPCPGCASAPCRTACPAAALTETGYDVPACRAWLDSPEGQDCRTQGCRVRRSCPVGSDRQPQEQSAFHAAAFRGRQGA